MMKRKKMLIVLGLLMAAVTFAVPQSAKAAGKVTTVYDGKEDDVDPGESKSYSFSVPVKSNVQIVLEGIEKDEMYGIDIVDSSGGTVFTKTGFGADKKTTIKTIVNAGKYILKITSPSVLDEEGDEAGSFLFYDLTLKTSPNGTYKTTKIKLNKTNISCETGDVKQLKATLTPAYATDTVKWSSSNPKIVKVSKNGKITVKNLGTATITAKAGKKTAKCKVSVKNTFYNIKWKKTTSAIKWVKYIKGYKSAKWTSSKKSVATVKNGKITGKKEGFATITAKIKGVKYKIKVYVYDPNGVHDGGGSGE